MWSFLLKENWLDYFLQKKLAKVYYEDPKVSSYFEFDFSEGSV